MTDFRRGIAKQLVDGPAWAQSFRRLKPTLDRMVADGDVERVKPSGGRARNMVRLTSAGEQRWLK